MTDVLFYVLVLWIALGLDVLFGEPPSAAHPVAWIGRVIGAFFERAPKRGITLPFMAGLVFVVAGTCAVLIIGEGIHRVARSMTPWVGVLMEAVVLKLMLSLRALLAAGREVTQALLKDDLPEARRLVSWHLVSRDTSRLTASQVAAATIESLAENASDSVVSPLFWYVLLGLPGALACRFINTCDAMLGYRDTQREWLGKSAARLDDLLHLVPARLTAGMILIVGAVLSWNPVSAVRIWWRDCWKTASPNAGHPMSAAAGVLVVELEKVGCYRLGEGQRLPEAADVRRAQWLIGGACLLAAVLLSGCLLLRHR